jgi:hypothetical protein
VDGTPQYQGSNAVTVRRDADGMSGTGSPCRLTKKMSLEAFRMQNTTLIQERALSADDGHIQFGLRVFIAEFSFSDALGTCLDCVAWASLASRSARNRSVFLRMVRA